MNTPYTWVDLAEFEVTRRRELRVLLLIALIVFWNAAPAQQAQQQSSDVPGWAQPYSLQISPMCLNFMVVGICIWITCTGYGCNVETSIKYGHFNPDAVVEVVNPQGVNRVEDPKRTETQNRNHSNLVYKEANALGHLLAGEILCPSQADALTPYFSSVLDSFSWRWGFFDMLYPATYIPGLREIGEDWPLNTWGALFPRVGWTTQHSEPKSAAINAQRVGDIITRSGEPHIYNSMTGPVINGQYFVWPPSGLLENTYKQGYWQRIFPTVLTQSAVPNCEVFGVNDTVTAVGWGGGKVSQTGDYAYTLWRPYTCCEIKGAVLVYIDFVDYPP